MTPTRCLIAWKQCLTPANVDYPAFQPLSHVTQSILALSTSNSHLGLWTRPPSPLSDVGSDYDISSQPYQIPVDNLLIIKTSYIIHHPLNQKKAFNSTDSGFIWEWTLEQRQLAGNAKVAKNVSDLQEKVIVFYYIIFLNNIFTLVILEAK
jgi:hypothetical protein